MDRESRELFDTVYNFIQLANATNTQKGKMEAIKQYACLAKLFN